jgi:hypothetical protein
MTEQKELLVKGQEPQDEDVQTSVTFKDPEGMQKPVTMFGVTFLPNQSVDLKEFMPEDQAKERAKSLAGNPFFQVAGTPDVAKENEERETKRAQHEARAAEESRKLAAETERRAVQGQIEALQQRTQEAPPEYVAPEEPRLENAQPTRKGK